MEESSGVSEISKEAVANTSSRVEQIKQFLDRNLTQPNPQKLSGIVQTEGINLNESQTTFIDNLGKELQEKFDQQKRDQSYWPEGRKPKSAGPFIAANAKERTTVSVKDFDSNFSSFADNLFYGCMNQIVTGVENSVQEGIPLEENEDLKNLLSEVSKLVASIKEAKELYIKYSKEVIPFLRQAVGKLNTRAAREVKVGVYKGEVVLGHGADPILWALISSRWKRPLGQATRIVEVDIGTMFFEDNRNSPRIKFSQKEKVLAFLQRKGIGPDWRWIDTGYYGNAAFALIRLLDPHRRIVKDPNTQISLLRRGSVYNFFYPQARETVGIEHLTPKLSTKTMEFIDEEAPRAAKSPAKMEETEEGFRPEVKLNPPADRLKAYAIRQSVVRSFLPKPKLSVGNRVIF